MIAYTGIETVSNLAEEARDPLRAIPKAISWVAVAVFAIYFTLPWIALSAMPVVKEGGDTSRSSARDRRWGSRTTPCSSRREPRHPRRAALRGEDLRRRPRRDDPLHRDERGDHRRVAHHLLDGDVPAAAAGFRRLHPKLKTPWLSLLVFAGIAPTLFLLSGQVDFLGRMYAFGAMLSFTIAHVAVTALRVRKRDEELPWRARPNLTIRGISWPLFAIVGGLGTGAAWLVVVVQDAPTRYAGLGWLIAGFGFYLLYRRKLGEPLRKTVRAPVVIRPRRSSTGTSSCRSLGRPSDEAMDVACRSRERGSPIVAMTVIHVPLELPLDAYLPDEVEEANEQLDEARAIGESYGVNVIARIVRARNSGRAIVEATRRSAEIIVMGGPRRVRLATGRRAIFGDTVDFVLKHAPIGVMVAAGSTGEE